MPAAQALLERIVRSLGAKVSWSRLARELGVPLGSGARRRGGEANDPRTVQSYVELLAVNYFALILYFWKGDAGSGDLAKDKKLYFGDPLLYTIATARAGLPRDRHAEVENALALALYRRYEPAEHSAEGFRAPERLHVWGTRRGGEIDFVCSRGRRLGHRQPPEGHRADASPPRPPRAGGNARGAAVLTDRQSGPRGAAAVGAVGVRAWPGVAS
jgi:predicted AAA+ superfamily ATPase